MFKKEEPAMLSWYVGKHEEAEPKYMLNYVTAKPVVFHIFDKGSTISKPY